ncbi:hypothetical protein QMK33_12615 [Hymenobacter sp. H14-R3]|uniref:hypothetical protein n=1 Tax=Hymenobacter sp. H14-R3 TaxID=3046308 RepID=UPI0024BA41B2|nr:hypothetical protein [Hymenobacter sp. H14-R3]MDJ0365998.1 hypothetical protein [Hymenobacter sp. H14-R3]
MLILADLPLKSFLRLFEAETPLQVIELGDTAHPGSGYVDEALVGNVTRVGHLLAHPYDFAGLVYLEAVLPQLLLTYQHQRYVLSGDTKPLARLTQRVRELNAAAGGPQFVLLNA